MRRDDSRPLGIAARRYYRTSYHPGPWFESWLDLWEGDLLLPGYGWLFPVAGGRINLGAGLLNTFKDFKQISAQRLFDAFATMLPADWEHRRGARRGPRAVRPAADEHEPRAAGGARAAAGRATPPAP